MGTAVIRPARPEDTAALGTVGPAAYAAAYGYLWEDGDALAAQLESFGAQAVHEFLSRQDTAAWVAEINGLIVGFLTIVFDSPDPATREPGGVEIPRIYLLPGAQKRGLGRKLVECAIAYARSHDRAYVWLDVMESATHARAAYIKWGFEEVGTSVFAKNVKPGLAGMVVLKMHLRSDRDR